MSVHTKNKSGFSLLGEDEDILGLVINKVKDREDRKSFSRVCKRWFRIEGLDRSSLNLYLGRPRVSLAVLTRFPNLVHFELWDFKTHTDLAFVARTCPKLESILIGCEDGKQEGDGGNVSPEGIRGLGDGCPKLSLVEIIGPNAIGNSGVAELVHSAHSLEGLIFLDNRLISDESLRSIGSSTSIGSLEFVNCRHFTDEGLAFLANGSISKTLKQLNLDICRKITNSGIELLNKMCCLEDLELYGGKRINHITDIGGVGISAIRTLKNLTLNHLGVSDPTMFALAQKCRNLGMLDIAGSKRVTGAGMRAFCGHKCLKSLRPLMLTNYSLSDVEQVVLGCPSLNSVLVKSCKRLDPTWSNELMHKKTRRAVKYDSSYAIL